MSSTYVPTHRGTLPQRYARVWEIAKACGVESKEVVAVLRQNGYDRMMMCASSKVPIAWAVGVAHEIAGPAGQGQ